MGNNYNLRELDGTVSGLIRVAPVAIFTALFRPFPWEIGSPAMVLSAIENSILLIFTLIKTRIYRVFKIIINNPFLSYCMFFSMFFAFGVGVSGTNFGALVRYKTSLMPFFFSMIYLIRVKARSF